MKEEIIKKINIYQKSGRLQLEDVDDSDLEEYCKRVSLLLKSKEISIVRVTSGCAIIRPSDTSAIVVTEEKTIEKKKEKSKEIEDVITDD